jgi:DNA (cytosine-5)-methyltransferase 1
MRMLGMTSVVGIEWDHAACLTAVAAGHRRIRADVSKYCIDVFAGAQGLIASPPCQAWSMAGKRQGEIDRAKVHALVDAYANGGNDPGTGWADERSHHAAQPVRWVRQLRPKWAAFEQVPAVLSLWEHAAERFRRWGYATWTGILNAADFGVPQTRERAILIARLDGAAQPPTPTHSRSAHEMDLFGESRLPWVSMAAALGWGDVPTVNTRGERKTPGGNEFSSGRPSWALTEKTRSWSLDRRTNSRGGKGSMYPTPQVDVDRPAPTLTRQVGHQWLLHTNRDQQPDGTRQTVATTRPAPAFTAKSGGQWTLTRPATTVQGDPRVGRPGHKDRAGGESQFEQDPLKISQAEAAVLQSFRADYPWQGTKTKQFEQIGNAVPPLLAAHIICAITGRKVPV